MFKIIKIFFKNLKATIWSANSLSNKNKDPFYSFFCANSNNSADFIRFGTQLPLCGKIDSSKGLQTECCNTNNCNYFVVPPAVEHCYQGGNFTNYPFSKPVSQASLSPYNKYCNVRIKNNKI